MMRFLASTLVASIAAGPLLARADGTPAGSIGGPGLAIKSAKILTCADGRGVVDRGVLLVRDGKIEAVAEARGF